HIRKQGYQFPAPDVKPTKKYKNLYHGEEVVIAKDEGMIAKDVPAVRVGSGSQMPMGEPAHTPPAPPPAALLQPSSATAVSGLAAQGQVAMSEHLLGKDHQSNIQSSVLPSSIH
ncbi:MAG: hypothetical protein HZB10_01560, partial [Candidatus Yonathbacteria bacterium]|nr:hypothetical protein [Candidatus Yonathbacteria bacterium]